MVNFFHSKKANVGLDAIMVIVVLFIFAVASVIGYIVIKDTNDDMQADPDINPQAKATMSQVTTQYPDLMDNAFIFILGLLWILAIVASFFVDAHPIFLGLAIFVLVVVLFVAGSVNNVHAEFIDGEDVSVEAQSFPKTNWVMDHLLVMILSIAVTVVIALYGKSRLG